MGTREKYFDWPANPWAIELIKTEWAKGTPAKNIAEMIGVSNSAVLSKARYWGLKARPRGCKPGAMPKGLQNYVERKKAKKEGAQL